MTVQYVQTSGGVTIGVIEGDTFHRVAQGSKHLFKRKPGPGWAISEDVLRMLEGAGVEFIRIVDTETNVAWKTTLSRFLRMARPMEFGDYGPQQCMKLGFFARFTVNTDDDIIKDLI